MDSQEMTLPNAESVFTVNSSLAEILRHPSKAWVMDPPPWIISKLPHDVLIEIEANKLEHLSELAKIEGNAKEVEAKMYSKMAKLLSPK